MEPVVQEVVQYVTRNNACPLNDWLLGLKDLKARAIIRKRINRVRLGNFGITRHVGEGVWELKIDFGPGYRLY